jgi:hypothetical protein
VSGACIGTGLAKARWATCSREDYGLVEKNALYRCLDRVLAHKAAFFSHLKQRWQDLFGARFEVLLYDLTLHLL